MMSQSLSNIVFQRLAWLGERYPSIFLIFNLKSIVVSGL